MFTMKNGIEPSQLGTKPSKECGLKHQKWELNHIEAMKMEIVRMKNCATSGNGI